jgi:hypothetical protein
MEKFAILHKMWLQKILRIINGIIILSVRSSFSVLPTTIPSQAWVDLAPMTMLCDMTLIG